MVPRTVSPRARARSASAPASSAAHAATRDADVDVDEHLADAVARGRVDRRLGVDRDGDARAAVGQRAQAVVVDRLVREQQVVAEPGAREAEQLSRRRAVKPRWPRLACSRASAVHLCAFTCGRSRAPGSAAVIVSRLRVSAARVDHERRSREIGDAHQVPHRS